MRIKPTLELFCMVDALAGRHSRVAFVQGALSVPVERIGVLWERELAAAVAKARAALGEETWQSAFAAGRMLSLVEMAAEVLCASE